VSESFFIEHLAYSFDQCRGISVKMKSANLNCMAAREWLQGLGQFAHQWHVRPINENGYDRNVMGKRRNDFDRNEVVRTLDPMPSRFVLSVQPAGTDDRQKRLAHRHLITQACFKVDPDEIHEEIFVPKCLRYPVIQPTGCLRRTFSTVIDENLTAHGPGRPPKANSIAGLVESIGRCPL
jgi:hypothetical protein